MASYECFGCGSKFVLRKSFDIHINRSSQCFAATRRTNQCGKCKEQFGSLEDLQKHIKGHTVIENGAAEKKECVYCGKCFTRSDHLRQHLWIHSGDKPYKCEHCGKSFGQGSSLQQHLRIHSGDPKTVRV